MKLTCNQYFETINMVEASQYGFTLPVVDDEGRFAAYNFYRYVRTASQYFLTFKQ